MDCLRSVGRYITQIAGIALGASMRHSLTASLFAAGLLLGSGVAASAADMAVKAPPPVPLYDWTGWYGGVNVGYSWGHSTTTTTPNDPLLAAHCRYPES